jgi:hypothetical protein
LLALPVMAADGPPKHPNSEGPGSWAWPLELNLPESVTKPTGPPYQNPPKFDPAKLPVLAWWPPEAKHIRAVLLISQNTDSMAFGVHPAVRAMAKRREMAIVYLRYSNHNSIPAETNTFPAILRHVAGKSGIVEFEHAPWIPFGKSSMGRFPINLAWYYPERTLAGVTWHGEVPPCPPPDWARLKNETIPWINVNGEVEWGGTWYRHVRPCLLNYRAQRGWLAHQVVSWGVDHGNYPEEGSGRNDPTPRRSREAVWDYMALWLDRIIALRLPAEGYPTTGPLTLRNVDEATGYYIDSRATEELLGLPYKPLELGETGYKVDPYKSRSPGPGEPTPSAPRGLKPGELVRKAADVPATERAMLFWVPDKDVAEAWVKLHTPKKPAE